MGHGINGPHLRPEELVGALHDRDELDEYLAEKMQDPTFRLAYDRAGWVYARWWRRWLNRWFGVVPVLEARWSKRVGR